MLGNTRIRDKLRSPKVAPKGAPDRTRRTKFAECLSRTKPSADGIAATVQGIKYSGFITRMAVPLARERVSYRAQLCAGQVRRPNRRLLGNA